MRNLRTGDPRWSAVVSYKSDAGVVEVTHDLEELKGLHDLVEAGPSFQCIVNIVITYNNGGDAPITVEHAREL